MALTSMAFRDVGVTRTVCVRWFTNGRIALVVAAAAHRSNQPANAERDRCRGVRPGLDEIAYDVLDRFRGILESPDCVGRGVARLPIEILGASGGLIELTFDTGLRVA